VSKPVEHLYELKISWAELENLTVKERSVFGLLCYAASEMNVLSRIYLETMHPLTGEPAIDTGLAMQRHIVLRSLSSRAYEAYKFLRELKVDSNESGEYNRFVNETKDASNELKNAPGYSVNDILRNEATNHYDLNAAVKSWPFLDKGANNTMYMHSKDGNSYFALGEELMFFARLRRLSNSRKEWKEPEAIVGAWLDWALEVKKLVSKAHVKFFEEIVAAQIPNLAADKRHYFLDEELVSNTKHGVPLFHRGNRP